MNETTRRSGQRASTRAEDYRHIAARCLQWPRLKHAQQRPSTRQCCHRCHSHKDRPVI